MDDGYKFMYEEIYRKRLQGFQTEENVVKNFLGIQSQFYRYAMLCCKLHGDDFELNRKKYFRAWTIRGTMHIHHIEDYNVMIYKDMLTPYMRDFWEDETVVSMAEKIFFCEIIITSLKNGNFNKKQMIELCVSNGMTPEQKEYLFNPWGGLPRYLMETGKIILLCGDDSLFQLAPSIELKSREDAETEQVRRYLEGYSPCTIADVMYFFKWNKKKCQIIVKNVLERYFANQYTVKKIGEQEYIFLDDNKQDRKNIEDIYVLSAFDPIFIGYEKKDNFMLPGACLRKVFTMQGIVKPTILYHGEVNGTWKIKDRKIYVELFQNMPGKYIEKIKNILENITGIYNIIITK